MENFVYDDGGRGTAGLKGYATTTPLVVEDRSWYFFELGIPNGTVTSRGVVASYSQEGKE